MQWETASENVAAVDALDLQAGDRVLEAGFGHGRNLQRMAERVSNGLIAGIDPSGLMVRLARRRLRKWVAANRMDLRKGTTERLPFEAGAFDKILAVHVAYFWENPGADLTELRRVVSDGGRLVLALRHGKETLDSGRYPTSVYHLHDTAEWERLAKWAGFSAVTSVSRLIRGRTIVLLTAIA